MTEGNRRCFLIRVSSLVGWIQLCACVLLRLLNNGYIFVLYNRRLTKCEEAGNVIFNSKPNSDRFQITNSLNHI